ncbi:hypothetical protein Tco_0299102 [Tanacetum coccineum]
MENANPSSSTSNNEFFDPKKTIEIESWLEDSGIVDSLVGSDEIEYFDTFPTLEELEYHEWLLKYPKPSWEEGTVTFKKDNEKITFKMPHKMETFNHKDLKDVNTDSIPPFVLENNDDRGKTYYSDSLTLGPEYREDESISKEIRQLMKLERESKRHKGEVTLYLIRRSLEVLRKFHWMILGGRFNLLSYVFSTWMAFGGNTRDLGSFGEETDEITDLHQIHEEILFSERGDGVAGIKQRRRDPSSDGVRDLVTASGRGRLNEDLESSTWRRC